MLSTCLIIVTYNHLSYLPALFSSIQQIRHAKYSVLIIDNNSTDGTQDYLSTEVPFADVILNGDNKGFCGANNQGIVQAFAAGADVCVLLNPDTVVTPDFLAHLEKSYLEQQKRGERIGMLQPVILLKQQPESLNTDGNAIHYLGFSWCKNNNSKKPVYQRDFKITGVSGACLYMPKAYFEDIGLFNELFFAYAEDQDLSWRGLLRGYQHICSHQSIIYHDYSFSKSNAKWLHAEKNRLMLLIHNYRLRTLILLALPLVSMEVVMIFYSIARGFFLKKWQGYKFISQHWVTIQKTRQRIQIDRSVSDHEIWRHFDKTLVFSEIKYPLLTWVVNPLLRVYAALVSPLL